jgi:hypothetical protein
MQLQLSVRDRVQLRIPSDRCVTTVLFMAVSHRPGMLRGTGRDLSLPRDTNRERLQRCVRASIEAVGELAPQSPDCLGTPSSEGSEFLRLFGQGRLLVSRLALQDVGPNDTARSFPQLTRTASSWLASC